MQPQPAADPASARSPVLLRRAGPAVLVTNAIPREINHLTQSVLHPCGIMEAERPCPRFAPTTTAPAAPGFIARFVCPSPASLPSLSLVPFPTARRLNRHASAHPSACQTNPNSSKSFPLSYIPAIHRLGSPPGSCPQPSPNAPQSPESGPYSEPRTPSSLTARPAGAILRIGSRLPTGTSRAGRRERLGTSGAPNETPRLSR